MYDVVYVIKSVWMSDHALHFVISRGVWGVAGGNFPLSLCFLAFWLFFWGGGLSAQSRTVMMIIPLPSGGATGRGGGQGANSPPYDFRFCLFVCLFFGLSAIPHYDFFFEKCVGAPPPPPKQSPWRRPYPIMVIILPPADCRFQG